MCHRLRDVRDDAGRVANAAGAAAIFREVADQVIHRSDIGAIPDEPALRMRGNETRARQLLQVKRERRRRYAEPLGNVAGGQALGRVLDQQAEYRKAVFLRQRAQGRQRSLCFHVFNNMKIWRSRQPQTWEVFAALPGNRIAGLGRVRPILCTTRFDEGATAGSGRLQSWLCVPCQSLIDGCGKLAPAETGRSAAMNGHPVHRRRPRIHARIVFPSDLRGGNHGTFGDTW